MILKDSKYLQYPYLVELSSRANTTLEDTLFHLYDLVYPKEEILYLLEILKHLSIFSNNIRLVIMKKLISIVECIEISF